MEDSIAAGKAILGAKSVHEAIEIQTDFAKTAFENYVAELTKFNKLFTAPPKDSFAPLQGRAQAWVDLVQTRRLSLRKINNVRARGFRPGPFLFHLKEFWLSLATAGFKRYR